MSTEVSSGSWGEIMAELGTKLRKISFSFFLSTKQCSFPNQSDRMSSKAKQQTYQLIQALFLQMILHHSDRHEAHFLTLFFGRIAFSGDKKAFCILEVELWRALLVIEYSLFSPPAGYWRFNICRNSHEEANKISICLQSHNTAGLPASYSKRVKTTMLCHGKIGQKGGWHCKYAGVAKQRSATPRNYSCISQNIINMPVLILNMYKDGITSNRI